MIPKAMERVQRFAATNPEAARAIDAASNGGTLIGWDEFDRIVREYSN